MRLTTAHLPDAGQRMEPIELMGTVIGTAGTPAYIHLQLELSKRLFGDSMPVLIVNDGIEGVEALDDIVADYPFATLNSFPLPLGHSVGDIRVFKEGMEWCKERGLDIMVKLSRRFVPLVPWRHGLQVLAAENPNVCCFTRRHNDRPDGLFRTDAIALRVRKLDNEQTRATIDESLGRGHVNVEPMFEAFARANGGWAVWDLLGPSFYRPYAKAMQWRGLLAHHYGDLSRELGLPYTDDDFFKGTFTTEPAPSLFKPTDATAALVIAPPGS